MFLYLLCVLPVLVNSLSTLPPSVTLSQGHLRGRWFITRGGRKVAGFLAIPYASPPVGHLRFKSPIPPKAWAGVLNATEDAPGCIQAVDTNSGRPTRPTTISEDCLYVNVYSPNVSPSEKIAVLVYFYGGGFEGGFSSSSSSGPDYLLDEEVVLVTFNYRVGILGFLSLEHSVLPGNLGLKDQRLVLRWVKDNIGQFGGDPTKVTIFGQSVGAVSVHFHSMFTIREGLFRAAIANSGTGRTLFAIRKPGSQKPLIEKLINVTNCPSDPIELVECLRQLPANQFENILVEVGKTSSTIATQMPLFTPMIEPECVEDAVITANPFNTTISIPLLQGVNELEGLLKSLVFDLDESGQKLNELNSNYKSIIPYNLYLEDKIEKPQATAEDLKNFYFGKQKIDMKHYIDLVNLFSDAFFNYPMLDSTRVNKDKTYVYQFNYKGSNTIQKYRGSQNYYGVAHTDDLFYLFPLGGPRVRNVTESDTAVSKTMVKMWTNFAKYLDPTPTSNPTKWLPVTSPSIEYLNIGQYNYSMEKDFLKTRMAFWNNLPFTNKRQMERPRCKTYKPRRSSSSILSTIYNTSYNLFVSRATT